MKSKCQASQSACQHFSVSAFQLISRSVRRPIAGGLTARTTSSSYISHLISHIANPKSQIPHLTSYLLTLIIFILFTPGCTTSAPQSPRLAAHTLRPDNETLALAQAAEFDTIVQVFPWREIEPTRGQFHWEAVDQVVAGAEYYGLDLVVRLDQHPAWASEVDLTLNAPPDNLDDYGNFVRRVAERYRGRIRAYIIWNEPNLAIEWGGRRPDPVAFTELLRVGYEAVQAGDPEALVVAAGLAPTNSDDGEAIDERRFLGAMYQAGAAPYFDVLGAHPYSFGQAPGAPSTDSRHPAFGRLAELREIMQENRDAHKPVWITELGWTIDPPPEQPDIGVDLEQQAGYLVEALNLVRRDWPWVELITVWNLSRARPGDPFGGYSLLDERGRPRPAFEAWQQAAGSRTERGLRVAQTERHNPISILGQDTIVHLGDTNLQPPWWPLYAGRDPSLTWTGGFYVTDLGVEDWTLLLELMQQNELGAAIEINDIRLSPDLPQQDLTRRWLTVQRPVPASILTPGYNELTITTVRLLPDAQHDEFVWDDFQVRNIRLVRN